MGLAFAALLAAAQVAPYTSFRKLVSANGWSPIVYDLETRRLVSFREHLYRYPAPGEETRELAYDMYLGLRINGTSAWLTGTALDSAAYETGTGLIRTVQTERGVRVTTTYVAPFGLAKHAFLVVAELENTGADASDVALFTIHNFHTGGGANQTQGEHIEWNAALGAYLESSSAWSGVLLAKPLAPATHHTASPANPYPLVNQSMLFGDVDDSGTIDDAVSGFELDVNGRGAFPHGARASFALVIGEDSDASSLSNAIDAWSSGKSPEALLDAERARWNAWHRSGVWPGTDTQDEEDVAVQSLAMLRMAQVQEPGAPQGAIVASLPPGRWDICWLRDAMFAAEAFTRTGHHDEAEAMLDFAIRGPFGDYQTYVGVPYGLTLARYYGNGREESDSNANGPNIELDGFGMYLEEAALHVLASGRHAWLTQNRAHLDAEIAAVLAQSFRDPETQLIAADSSIWESHWTNGGRQRWAFTSGRAVRGLDDWAGALEMIACPADAEAAADRAAADGIHAAMLAHLVDPASGALAASVEQLQRGSAFADAQVALILRGDRIDPASALGAHTLDFLRDRLFLSSTTRRGYKRNDDGDVYDNREWLVIDLGISRALREAGRTAEADALLSWVTAEAKQNFGLVAELLDENDAHYAGEVPMIGFGAGAYVNALIARSGTKPAFGGGGGEDAGTNADTDATSPDAATPSTDAATAGEDAAGANPDSGVIAGSDAATSGPDSSTSTHKQSESSCACDAASPASPAASALPVAILLVSRLSSRRRPRK